MDIQFLHMIRIIVGIWVIGQTYYDIQSKIWSTTYVYTPLTKVSHHQSCLSSGKR